MTLKQTLVRLGISDPSIHVHKTFIAIFKALAIMAPFL